MRIDKRQSEQLPTYEQEKEQVTKRYQSELNDLKGLIIGGSLTSRDKYLLLKDFATQLIELSLLNSLKP